MSKKNTKKYREYLTKTYNHLYITNNFGDSSVCTYCGSPREALDHVPPLSVVDTIGTNLIKENNIELIRVPCCTKCNSVLGSKKLGTLSERIYYLYDYYNNKYDKEVFWSKDGIEELSGNLKRLVQHKQITIRNELIDRIRGLENSILNKDKMQA